MSLSVCIITLNEEANLGRTLASAIGIADEVVIVDNGSIDRTLEIARSFGAKVKVYTEPWKGFAAQKNSAIGKATCEYVLSLDADEEVSPELAESIRRELAGAPAVGYWLRRRNLFLGRWVRRGGFYPDPKLRLFRCDAGRFSERAVHETVELSAGREAMRTLQGDLIHHAYPTLTGYIDHMNRYSSLGAELAANKGQGRHLVWNVVVRPAATFLYNYVFRLGFLDGQEGLLLHLYHAVYVSWKYAKAWEMGKVERKK